MQRNKHENELYVMCNTICVVVMRGFAKVQIKSGTCPYAALGLPFRNSLQDIRVELSA